MVRAALHRIGGRKSSGSRAYFASQNVPGLDTQNSQSQEGYEVSFHTGSPCDVQDAICA